MDASELLELADLALTQAKKAGRDRISVAPVVTEGTLAEARALLASHEFPRKKTIRATHPSAASSEPALAHVRTILAAIERLQAEPLTEEARRQTEILHAGALRLETLLGAPQDTKTARDTLPASRAAAPVAAVPAETAAAPAISDNEAIFASAELLERVGQDRDIANNVIAQFLQDAPTRLRELSAALAREALHPMRLKAHSIKGMAANIAARRLCEAAMRLESAENALAAQAHLQQLQSEYEELAPRLQRWIAEG